MGLEMRLPFRRKRRPGRAQPEGSEWSKAVTKHLPPSPAVRAAPAVGTAPGRLWGAGCRGRENSWLSLGAREDAGGSLPDVELM